MSKNKTQNQEQAGFHIPAEDRTLRELAKLDAKVYIYCGDRRTLEQFAEDADNEYFHYGDGTSPKERKPDNIMGLNPDRTVNYVGYVGNMAFRSAEVTTVGIGRNIRPLVRVDYRKYVAGYEDFIYRP